MPSGDVALFIATPGSLNIQPRIDGAQDTIKKSRQASRPHTIATGAAVPKELSTIDAYWQGHQDTKGMFAVDAGSTQGVAQVIKKYNLRGKGVKGGGYDLLPPITEAARRPARSTSRSTSSPTCRASCRSCSSTCTRRRGTLTGLADVNTGLKFLDKETVVPYNTTKSRYEGSSSSAGVAKA